jgi:CHAD domain-containing protein
METHRAKRPDKSAAVKSSIEQEIKLAIDANFRLPVLQGTHLSERTLTTVYFDTPDLRLLRAQITLRHRTDGRKRAWQLKLPLTCGRREVEMPGDASAPPAEMLSLLFIHLQGTTVGPIATLRTRRTGTRVGSPKKQGAEVILDEVAVLKDSSEVLSFREVEIERLNGDTALADRLEKQLRKAGAFDHDGRPKIFRALDLPTPPPLKPPRRSDSIAEHLRYTLIRQLDILLSRDPGVRLGGESEDVHQMRVAARRMRAVLRAARPLLKREWEEPLRTRLGWLGRQLSAARDLDVQIAHFKGQYDSVKPQDRPALDRFIDYLQGERAKVQRQLVRQLRRRRYVGLINRLTPAVREPMIVSDDITLPDLAGKAFRKLQQAVKPLDVSASNAQWHGVRIRAKRARYAAELSERYSGHAATQYLDQMKRVQELLGDIQDAVMAERHLRRFASKREERPSALIAGQMIERARERQRDAKEAFGPVWKKVKKCGKRVWG